MKPQRMNVLHLRFFYDLVSKLAINYAKEIWLSDSFCVLYFSINELLSFSFKGDQYFCTSHWWFWIMEWTNWFSFCSTCSFMLMYLIITIFCVKNTLINC
jgi:hypothetical protein